MPSADDPSTERLQARIRQLEALLREIIDRELNDNPALWKRVYAALNPDPPNPEQQ